MRLDPDTFNEISLSLVPLATAPNWVKSLWVEKELQVRGMWQDAVFDHVRPFLVSDDDRQTSGRRAAKSNGRARNAALTIDDGGGSWKSLISKSGGESPGESAEDADSGLTPAQADLASIMHIIAVCAREVEPQVQEFAGPAADITPPIPESTHEVGPVEADEVEDIGISWADELRNPADVEPASTEVIEDDSQRVNSDSMAGAEHVEDVSAEPASATVETPVDEFTEKEDSEGVAVAGDGEPVQSADANSAESSERVQGLSSIEWIVPQPSVAEDQESKEDDADHGDQLSTDEYGTEAPVRVDDSKFIESAADALRGPGSAKADKVSPDPGEFGYEQAQADEVPKLPVSDPKNVAESQVGEEQPGLTESTELSASAENIPRSSEVSGTGDSDTLSPARPLIEPAVAGPEDISPVSSTAAAPEPFVEPFLTLVPDVASRDPVDEPEETGESNSAETTSQPETSGSFEPQYLDSAASAPENQQDVWHVPETTNHVPLTAEHDPAADHSALVEFETDARADDQEAEVRAPVTPLFPEQEVLAPETVETGTEQATQLQLIPDDGSQSSDQNLHAESPADPSPVLPFTAGTTGTESSPVKSQSEQPVSANRRRTEQQAKPEASPATAVSKKSSTKRKRPTTRTKTTADSARRKGPKSSSKPKTRSSAKKVGTNRTGRGTSRVRKSTTVASEVKSTKPASRKPKTSAVAAQSRKLQRAAKRKAPVDSSSAVKPGKIKVRPAQKAPKPLVTIADAAAVADMFGIHIDTASISDDVRMLFFGAVVKANQGDWEGSQERLQAALAAMGDSAKSRIWRHAVEQSLKIKHRLDQHAA